MKTRATRKRRHDATQTVSRRTPARARDVSASPRGGGFLRSSRNVRPSAFGSRAFSLPLVSFESRTSFRRRSRGRRDAASLEDAPERGTRDIVAVPERALERASSGFRVGAESATFSGRGRRGGGGLASEYWRVGARANGGRRSRSRGAMDAPTAHCTAARQTVSLRHFLSCEPQFPSMHFATLRLAPGTQPESSSRAVVFLDHLDHHDASRQRLARHHVPQSSQSPSSSSRLHAAARRDHAPSPSSSASFHLAAALALRHFQNLPSTGLAATNARSTARHSARRAEKREEETRDMVVERFGAMDGFERRRARRRVSL